LENDLRFLKAQIIYLIPFKQYSRPSPKSCWYRNPTTSGQCRRNPVSSDSGDQTGRIPTIWPERPFSNRLAGSSQKGRFPAGWLNQARTAGSLPTGRDLPERPDSSGSGMILASRSESG